MSIPRYSFRQSDRFWNSALLRRFARSRRSQLVIAMAVGVLLGGGLVAVGSSGLGGDYAGPHGRSTSQFDGPAFNGRQFQGQQFDHAGGGR